MSSITFDHVAARADYNDELRRRQLMHDRNTVEREMAEARMAKAHAQAYRQHIRLRQAAGLILQLHHQLEQIDRHLARLSA